MTIWYNYTLCVGLYKNYVRRKPVLSKLIIIVVHIIYTRRPEGGFCRCLHRDEGEPEPDLLLSSQLEHLDHEESDAETQTWQVLLPYATTGLHLLSVRF